MPTSDRLCDTAAEFWVAAELEELFRLHGDDAGVRYMQQRRLRKLHARWNKWLMRVWATVPGAEPMDEPLWMLFSAKVLLAMRETGK